MFLYFDLTILTGSCSSNVLPILEVEHAIEIHPLLPSSTEQTPYRNQQNIRHGHPRLRDARLSEEEYGLPTQRNGCWTNYSTLLRAFDEIGSILGAMDKSRAVSIRRRSSHIYSLRVSEKKCGPSTNDVQIPKLLLLLHAPHGHEYGGCGFA